MSNISTITDSIFYDFKTKVESALPGAHSIEDAAQKFAKLIYDNFKESVVLARVFGTSPFGKLPSPNTDFVENLAKDKDIAPLLSDQTPVLSLLGTAGEQSEWNSRHNSKGHVGIPLVSKDFIELIPMISRLLKSMGLDLAWINSDDVAMVSKNVSRMAGLFYVADAKTNVDEKGRKIIAAQDFVMRHNVKTVFGFGGGYIIANIFVVSIIFTREAIPEEKVKRFMLLANDFKIATTSLAAQARIFS